MAKGENIFRRKDGRWEARYIKGYELSGKIKYGFCYGKTYREAKDKVTKCRLAVVEGKPQPQTTRRCLDAYCDEWLQVNRPRWKESTWVKYAAVLERHIKPALGSCLPQKITSALVEAFAQELQTKNDLSPKTVRDILTVLRSVLKYTQNQLPGAFPPIEVVYPKEPRQEMRVLSMEEQTRLVKYLLADMDDCKFGVLLALFTGMRIGELCALQWEHIDLQEKTVKVAATMQRLRDMAVDSAAKTKIVVGAPKSDTSTRLIPMTDAIAGLCAERALHHPASYVLTGRAEYMEPRTLQYRMQKYTRDCGLEGVHFHTLRHTFATRCVEVGFEIKSLSEILGHSATAVTLERYVHPSLELKRSNMLKLSAVGL